MISLYRSNNLRVLADHLASIISENPRDPMKAETIIVQSRSMDAWLRQCLSEKMGVIGHTEFPFPKSMIETSFQNVIGEEYAGAAKLESTSLVLSLYQSLTDYFDKSEFEAIRSYVGTDANGSKRFQLCLKISHMFDQYSVFRPQMVQSWEQGQTQEDQAWQAILWNELIRDKDLTYPAKALLDFSKALQNKASRARLPERISIFGISTLPPLYVDVINGLSQYIDVNMFLLAPSAAHWSHIKNHREIKKIAESQGMGQAEAIENLHLEIGNALLANHGKSGRDFQLILESRDYQDGDDALFREPQAGNLLQTLQADMFHLRERGSNTSEECLPMPLDPQDNSISIHSCHSPMREVEVLRDHIREALENDQSLNPRDIVVMIPDFETYAPLVDAVFSAHHRKTPEIPYSISDLSAQYNAPVIQAFLDLLHLGKSRMTVSEVLDLLAIAPVREKFSISSEDVDRIRGWLNETRVRWGIDEKHRERESQPAVSQNTWRAGLDRLLLGYAFSSGHSDYFSGLLPYSGLGDDDWELLGRFSRFAELLFETIESFAGTHTLKTWNGKLLLVLNQLISDKSKLAKQHQFIRTQLQEWLEAADATNFNEEVHLDVVKTYFQDKLSSITSHSAYLSGGVVFCAMLPMRSIPFRMVCLMGMNDRDFPRDDRELGFNLMHKEIKLGDRSARNDDRYLFLESLVSAKEKLFISYTGQGIQNNDELPPSVMVSDLIDCIRKSHYLPQGDKSPQEALSISKRRKQIESRLILKHRLQAFHQDYFDEEAAPRHFSYSQSHCEAANTLLSSTQEPEDFLPKNENLSIEQDDVLEMDQLIRFWKHPCEYLLTHVLNVRFPFRSKTIADREPIDLNSLESHGLCDGIMSGLMQGESAETMHQRFRAQGELPLGTYGDYVFADNLEKVEAYVEATKHYSAPILPDPVYVDLNCGAIRLTGAIPQVSGQGLLHYGYTNISGKHILDLWIRHLCLCASTDPTVIAHQSVLIGGGEKGVETFVLRAVENPLGHLEELIKKYQSGCTQALPFFPKTSYFYARGIHYPGPQVKKAGEERIKKSALTSAKNKWDDTQITGKPSIPGEGKDASIRRFFEENEPFTPEDSSFIDLSLEIFEPIFAHHEVQA